MLVQTLDLLQTHPQATTFMSGIRRGIERECLRVTHDGYLSLKPHSKKLGSKLTHNAITTDYSENLLELITQPHTSIDSLLEELTAIHAYTAQSIEDEYLWPMSMPCILADELSIPIADYGTSNSGRMKMHYRRGLWYRYGRRMQTIAGLHFNFSLPDHFWNWWQDVKQESSDQAYMGLIRNYWRYGSLIPILMGNSPACDASFLPKHVPDYLLKSGHTYYGEQATALRLSDIGYQSQLQDTLHVSYNSLDAYLNDLLKATHTPHPLYEAITREHGPDAQLNPYLLQIEAEHYAPIRPKQPTQRCERPIQALKQRGIDYIELRGIDVNPYSPIGVDKQQVLFLDVFLLFCLFQQSPVLSDTEMAGCKQRFHSAVLKGKAPHDADEIFAGLKAVARTMDKLCLTHDYEAAIAAYEPMIHDPTLRPSYRQLQAIEADSLNFVDIGNDLSHRHHAHFLELFIPSDIREQLETLTKTSLAQQAALEADSSINYQDYLTQYFK